MSNKSISPEEKKYKIISGVITTVVMAAIVMLCIAFGYYPPDPPIPENGVEVNLGNSDMGLGDNPEPTANETVSAASSQGQAEKVSTQSTEQSVAIPNNNKTQGKTTQEAKPTETKPEKPEEPKINQNALFRGGKRNNNSNGSQGTAGGTGDQGKEGGNPNSQRYDGQAGNGGSGFSLTGRSALAMPKPNYDSNKQGKVVVKIWVDREGNVTQVEAPAKGSTITEAGMVSMAKQAAMKAKFSASKTASESQTGTITYVFSRSN